MEQSLGSWGKKATEGRVGMGRGSGRRLTLGNIKLRPWLEDECCLVNSHLNRAADNVKDLFFDKIEKRVSGSPWEEEEEGGKAGKRSNHW